MPRWACQDFMLSQALPRMFVSMRDTRSNLWWVIAISMGELWFQKCLRGNLEPSRTIYFRMKSMVSYGFSAQIHSMVWSVSGAPAPFSACGDASERTDTGQGFVADGFSYQYLTNDNSWSNDNILPMVVSSCSIPSNSCWWLKCSIIWLVVWNIFYFYWE